ncbi:MAG TPA: phosphoribosylformylglycinamidine synthase subunit PurS [Gemmatimonadaceae bacterium]|nr:phosphoribosylformylglycinamidine synthase subunit PurS [Gemmatimonadaceae bacterium]
MSRFRVSLRVMPRQGILDPQGTAVTGALRALGFAAVHDTRVGRHIVVDLDAHDADAAREEVRRMCERLLANPVTEDFHLDEVEGV